MDNIIYASASALAQAIRDKDVSSAEVVKTCLERIEAVNPELNAVVRLVAERALDEAKAADVMLARGEVMGPLHGVPMTVKDSFDTAGVISTAGTLGREHFVPEQDATAVARLRAAGAILMGKTNTSELTLSFMPDNLIFGRTSNPYDLSRMSGGSSGGAAAIVAAGGAPLDIGSDYGGSIRLPAHFCGVAGIKPTSGRVPRTGHILPYDIGFVEAFQQIGPLVRTVDDLILTLPIMAGVDWRDPNIMPMPLGDAGDVQLQALKVAFHTDNGIQSPTAATAATVSDAVTALADAGLSVEEAHPPMIEETFDLFFGLAGSDGGALVDRVLQEAGTTERSFATQRTESWEASSPDELSRLLRHWSQFRSAMLAFIEPYDVIICPVNADVALLHGDLNERTYPNFSYTMTHNLTGWPAAVVRCGTLPDGLPIGVQIVGQPWREDVVLAVARFLETALGGWQPSPLFAD